MRQHFEPGLRIHHDRFVEAVDLRRVDALYVSEIRQTHESAASCGELPLRPFDVGPVMSLQSGAIFLEAGERAFPARTSGENRRGHSPASAGRPCRTAPPHRTP